MDLRIPKFTLPDNIRFAMMTDTVVHKLVSSISGQEFSEKKNPTIHFNEIRDLHEKS
jgi:hypothetical protein